METLHSFFLFAVLFFILPTGTAQDTIATDQAIRDNDTLVSADQVYELGFFSPGRSTNRYLGIWYKNISPQTVVWVANRETPITGSSGVFRVDTSGSLLVIQGSNNTVVWSSNTSLVSPTTMTPVAQLLSTGNLVVKESGHQERFIWQSFDYPVDTFLPGMKFGNDIGSGRYRQWIPWKSLDDPSPSEYVVFMDMKGYPQVFEEQGAVPLLRYGPWNGAMLNGLPSRRKRAMVKHEFVMNDREVYYRYLMINTSVLMRIYFNPQGNMFLLNWIERTQEWLQYWSSNIGMCSRYGVCGPYAMCNPNSSPACSCMDGFEPQNPEEWSASVWSSGCRRRTDLNCPNGDGFQVLKNVIIPDTRRSWYNRSMTLEECGEACRRNCSCTAYANMEITRGGSGCFMWLDDLVDVRRVDESHDLYVRVALSDITISGSTSKPNSNKRRQAITVVVPIMSSLVMIILVLALLYALGKKKRSQVIKTPAAPVQTISKEDYSMDSQEDDKEFSSFSLDKISKSTNNFADDKQLGEGGFGPVYKGVLDDGREVAVKRLSKSSRQGLEEFKNELKFIAKLQHRNLVKLFGYCIEGDESMLVYEYMPNKSLDMFIFDIERSTKLDWFARFHIIHGIARGLLYLHEDSRFKIVHRDLKAGNILLDADMNPKISDFGLARMFTEHENEAATNRVVGTFGYISPEYAIDGTFSEKSDVYSFGVLVLEIVSGKKNRGFSHENDSDNLLAHAWRLFKEGHALDLLCSNMHNSCISFEVLRSIHISLLCVQHHAKDRPSMSSVVLMFDQDGILPQPKQPAFFVKGSSPKVNMNSTNEITMTILEPR